MNLTGRDIERLAPYFDKESEKRRLLAEVVGGDPASYSESAVLRDLTMLGAQVIDEKAMEAGYEEYAKMWDEEADAWIEMGARAIAENVRNEERGSYPASG